MRRPSLVSQSGAWAPVVAGLLVYMVLFMLGFSLQNSVLNIVGGVGMLVVATLGNHRRMFVVRLEPASSFALALVAALGISTLSSLTIPHVSQALKWALALVLFIQAYSWRLAPLAESRWRWIFVALCVFLVTYSAATGRQTQDDGRIAGVFANPNNYALMGLAFLFFIRDSESVGRKAFIHAAALGTIAISGTLGAIGGYIAATLYRFRQHVSWPVVSALGVMGVAIVVAGLRYLPAAERVSGQYAVMRDNLSVISRTNELDYGDLAREYGDSSLSGVWRIMMWKKILLDTVHADPATQIFGAGVGTSRERFGNLPHNEYLRLLAETGVLGLLLFGGFAVSVWRALPVDRRPALLAFLVYSFSENNLDNFLFMSLLMLYLASSVRVGRGTGPQRHRASRTGNAEDRQRAWAGVDFAGPAST